MKKDLYIVRHGQTNYNIRGIIQGSIDAVLNETGHQQAARFYEAYKDFPFDKLYTSAKQRTWQSVQQFINAGLEWEQLAGLNEMHWGEFEGQQRTPELTEKIIAILDQWQAGNYTAAAPEAESPAQLAERLMQAMQIITGHRNEKKVLICMHGRSLRILLCKLLERELSGMDKFPIPNLGVYHLEYSYDNQKFTLKTEADTAHLQ